MGKANEFITNRFLEKIIKAKKFDGRIDEYREKHNNVCNLIHHADSFFQFYISETLVLNIIMICCVFYGLIYFPDSTSSIFALLTTLWYLIAYMTFLASACLSSAYVNVKAHELYEHLHRLNLKETAIDQIAQVYSWGVTLNLI